MLVDDCFAHGQEVGPSEICGAHSDAFRARGDVGGFVDVGGCGTAEEGDDPCGGGLVAGYQAFGAELAEGVRFGI